MEEIELIKSEHDSMEYRLITLPNGLRALLVSDVKNIKRKNPDQKKLTRKNTYTRIESMDVPRCKEDEKLDAMSKSAANKEKMGACSLAIDVGGFSDPEDIQGLAHFLEHMVFMGSEKYPGENEFMDLAQKYGGYANASTSRDTTCFYFECNEENLQEGIDRFAQFFISPLMSKDAMTREREAVNSEFELSLTSDGARQTQVFATYFAPDGHPAKKFLCGNLKTLKDNVDDDYLYEKVHEFRERHYSAHRMAVAVQARLPLDVLEKYVRDSFSDVPNNGLPPDDFEEHIGAFVEENFNKIIWLKPIYDICLLEISWILPPYKNEYKSLPLYTAGWLIGDEGEGSFTSFLRQKVWAFDCTAGVGPSDFEYNSLYSIFLVSIALTEEGYDHIDEIIAALFSFIQTIKENWPNDRILDELEQVNLTEFRFRNECPPVSYVETLSKSMHLYEPEHIIAGGDIYLERKPELVTEILEALSSDTINMTIYTNKKPDDFYDQTEEWFGTKYKVEDIPEEWINKWNEYSMQNLFHIPNPNPFIADDFSLLEPPEEIQPYPEKIQDDDLIELWYKQDTKFKRPVGMYCFYLKSPITNASALNAALLDVLVSYLEVKLAEPLYPAKLAGFDVAATPQRSGLQIVLSGYSQKLPIFFHEVLRLIRDFIENIEKEENERSFNAVLDAFRKNYRNPFLDPSMVTKQLMSIQIKEFWTFAERYNEIGQMSLESLHQFAIQYFNNVKILALVQGNISQDEAFNICEQFSEILGCAPLSTPMPREQESKMNPGEIYLRVKSFNKNDHNSVILNYYEDGPTDIRKSCIVGLLLMLMEGPLFDSLRNKQQLGYDVSCCTMELYKVMAFGVKVIFQAGKFDPDDVDSRIESFLSEFSESLKSMTGEEIEKIKKALVEAKNEEDLALSSEVDRNFEEICEDKYVFDRIEKQVNTIPEITHEELCEWLEEHIAGGKEFKKLSIQVINSVGENEGEEEGTNEESFPENFSIQENLLTGDSDSGKVFIQDLKEFKDDLEFYSF